MTPAEREEFYDAEVAPKLREIGRQCRERGLSFLAVVEWEPGEHGRTFCTSPPVGIGIRIANTAAETNGNIDGLILALIKYAREHGHNSMCLRQLGVPERPPVIPT